jgi:hypothetical protein
MRGKARRIVYDDPALTPVVSAAKGWAKRGARKCGALLGVPRGASEIDATSKVTEIDQRNCLRATGILAVDTFP